MRVFLLAVAMMVGAVSSSMSGQDSTGDALPRVTLPPEFDRILREYEQAWRRGDGEALSKLFAEDGFVLGNGAPAVFGRPAILRAYKGRGGSLVLHAFAYARDGRIGYIIGGYGREVGQPDAGKFTLTLRQDAAGRWWIVSDMDNGNARPPQHAH